MFVKKVNHLTRFNDQDHLNWNFTVSTYSTSSSLTGAAFIEAVCFHEEQASCFAYVG